MTDDWQLAAPLKPGADLLPLVGGNPVVAQLLAQRGMDTASKAIPFLDPDKYSPSAPDVLFGLEHAANLLVDQISRGRNILVWGDFDVDGQTSTALLASALQRLVGPDRIRYHIPNRFSEGHGIRLEKLTDLLSDPNFQPHCLLTCDTGITDGPAVGYAKDQGITVIITDHHDPPTDMVALAEEGQPVWGEDRVSVGQDSVRRSDAIVNPKFQPTDDPLQSLPGVGVAYKLIERVYAIVGHGGEEQELLDLAALGIVADVAEQVHDTRYLLQLGLRRLRETRRIGLLALMDVAGLAPETVDAESIGFQLGPRMNALGRLEDATVAVELLTTQDPVRAGQLAAKMERLNQQRRLLTSQITSAAMTMIDHHPEYLDYNALVLGHAAWHPGIVGIVASRMVEEFGKPAVLLVIPNEGPAAGSARSVLGVDIGASIAACSHLLLRFGGHPGAAGVTLPTENIDRFREELHRQVADHAIPGAPQGLSIDAELGFDQITMELAEQMQKLAPFGNGNPQPVFATASLRVTADRRIGRQANHRRLEATDRHDTTRPVIWFNCEDAVLPPEPFDLAYTVGINAYRGARSVQLRYIDSRESSRHVEGAAAYQSEPVSVRDLRLQEVDPEQLPSPASAVWYAEGMQVTDTNGFPPYSPRHQILPSSRASALVIWSIPPAPDLLRRLLDNVRPIEIVLCGRNTADDSLTHVLRHVAGMCRYALETDGLVQIMRMAARLGTTEAVVRHSLLWLEARGAVRLAEWQDADTLRVLPGSDIPNMDDVALREAEVEEELAEVRAFRRFFLRAKMEALGLRQAQTTAK